MAAARRELPPGGVVGEDYVFQGAGPGGEPVDVRLSDLFEAGKDSLATTPSCSRAIRGTTGRDR